jgi:hypothetical protein
MTGAALADAEQRRALGVFDRVGLAFEERGVCLFGEAQQCLGSRGDRVRRRRFDRLLGCPSSDALGQSGCWVNGGLGSPGLRG